MPTPEESRPFESEHSCRLQDPDEFDSFRREDGADTINGKAVDFIFGITDDSSELQAIRYPLSEGWAADEAREHCQSQDSIRFEPADPDADDEGASACVTCQSHAMRTTKSPGGSTVTKTTHADSVVTRDVDGEDVEMLRVPISSTRQDRDGDAFSEDDLRERAKQIRDEKPLVHDDHGMVGGGMFSRYPARETIGTQMDAELEEDDDGHHTLYAFINPDGTHPDGEGERMLAQVKDEKQAIKFSVGFRILQTADDMVEEDRPERANEVPGRLFTRTDLMETSRVGIPANPDASAGIAAKNGEFGGMAGRVPVAFMPPEQLGAIDSSVVKPGTPIHVDGQAPEETSHDRTKTMTDDSAVEELRAEIDALRDEVRDLRDEEPGETRDECTVDTDCPEGEVCIEGECVPEDEVEDDATPDDTNAADPDLRERYEALEAELAEVKAELDEGRGDPETPDHTQTESPTETNEIEPDETDETTPTDHETIFE